MSKSFEHLDLAVFLSKRGRQFYKRNSNNFMNQQCTVKEKICIPISDGKKKKSKLPYYTEKCSTRLGLEKIAPLVCVPIAIKQVQTACVVLLL